MEILSSKLGKIIQPHLDTQKKIADSPLTKERIGGKQMGIT